MPISKSANLFSLLDIVAVQYLTTRGGITPCISVWPRRRTKPRPPVCLFRASHARGRISTLLPFCGLCFYLLLQLYNNTAASLICTWDTLSVSQTWRMKQWRPQRSSWQSSNVKRRKRCKVPNPV